MSRRTPPRFRLHGTTATASLRLLAVAALVGVLGAACASTPDGEPRITGVGAQTAEGGAGAERLDPTSGLEGGRSGGSEPAEGSGISGSGLGSVNSGLPSSGGGSDPTDGAGAVDLSDLPGAADVLALIAGTLTGTYTIDYDFSPSATTAMVVSNEPGRQSIHSVALNGSERWSLYENDYMVVDCDKTTSRGWACQRVWRGSSGKGLLGLTVDPEHLVAGITAVQLNPALVLVLLTPPLEGTQGVASNSYRTSIAGQEAQCLQYAQQGRPPAEICANDDAVPVRLATQFGGTQFTFQARSYRRGVAAGAFVPPAPV